MMDRRTVIGMFVAGIIAAPLASKAQTAPAVRRIGFLGSGARPTTVDLHEGDAPLRALGWVEGKNLIVERRYANGRAELLRPLAEELVRLDVELIVTFGTDATLAAKNATTTIPIVIKSAGDPARSGLVASLARPGGNITGYSIISPELNAKRLALFRELLPGVQRIGWLENSTNPYYRATRKDLEQACRSLGIQPIFVQVAAASEVQEAVAEAARQRAQALFVPIDTLFYETRAEIMRAALKHALPTMAQRITVLEDGALIAYDPTLAEENDRNASFIDRILHGAKPAGLPIEQPTKFELIINLKTAKALGITIPPSLLLRADEVIQ
jgi:putative tryptophan/tyrosine transport system substrate-binding protein